MKIEGQRVYNTSNGGYYLRSLSYVDGFLELWAQLQQQDLRPETVYVCSGVHPHVGLVVGSSVLGIPPKCGRQYSIGGSCKSGGSDARDWSHLFSRRF